MKMLKNGLEVDGFATSRTPIQSPRSTKRVVVPRCAAHPPERLVQVHPDHHVEDGAVAVAEHADGADDEKRYKNSVVPRIVLVPCVANVEAQSVANVEVPNANAP